MTLLPSTTEQHGFSEQLVHAEMLGTPWTKEWVIWAKCTEFVKKIRKEAVDLFPPQSADALHGYTWCNSKLALAKNMLSKRVDELSQKWSIWFISYLGLHCSVLFSHSAIKWAQIEQRPYNKISKVWIEWIENEWMRKMNEWKMNWDKIVTWEKIHANEGSDLH